MWYNKLQINFTRPCFRGFLIANMQIESLIYIGLVQYGAIWVLGKITNVTEKVESLYSNKTVTSKVLYSGNLIRERFYESYNFSLRRNIYNIKFALKVANFLASADIKAFGRACLLACCF